MNPPEFRDGTAVKDSRFDRLVQFDERSRDFPIRAMIDSREVVSSTWKCEPRLDQGREGACVGFGWSHELAAEPVVVPVDAAYARQLYYDAQTVDQWPGGSYPGASPRYDGTSVLAGAKVLAARGLLPEYRWAFGLHDLLLAVGHIGPAVIGVTWYASMVKPDNLGFIRATGRILGGHCVAVTGVSTTRKAFRIHNSWGSDWGTNGQAWLSWLDMEKLLRRRGEACIPVRRLSLVQGGADA